MKLVYIQDFCHHKAGDEVKVGDIINIESIGRCKVSFFREPHKSSSEGKVSVTSGHGEREFYVGVIKAAWIEREDRIQECGHPESYIVSSGSTHHCSKCAEIAARPLVNESAVKVSPDTLPAWRIVEADINDGRQVASLTFTSDDGGVIEVDLRILNGRKIIVECEDLITGKGTGFYLEDAAMTAVINLPK